MALKKTLSYLLARGLPGIISLLTIMVYTRLLSPEIYGQYSIVLSLVLFTATMCFQWMQFSILRFHPKKELTEQVLLSSTFFAFIVILFITLPLVITLFNISLNFLNFQLLAFITLWILAYTFFEISIQLPITKGEPLTYGLLLAAKATLIISIGSILLLNKLELAAPIIAMAVSYSLLSIITAIKYWKNISIKSISRPLMTKMLQYGMPLSGTFIMSYLMSNSDRLMLAWLKGEESAGLYSASYDISSFSFMVLLLSIHLAFYPMIVKAYENKESIKDLFEHNIISLLLFSIVPGILYSFLVADFSQLVLGESFRLIATQVIPLITLATLFLGLKIFYFDMAFLLTHKTGYLLVIGLIGVIINIILNYFFIHKYGIVGAAYSTCISYFSILILSYGLGKSVLSLPLPIKQFIKVLIIFGLCLLSLLLLHHFIQTNFILDIIILLSVYSLLIYFFNLLDSRIVIKQLFQSIKQGISHSGSNNVRSN